jgi:hypothetical protein
MDTDVAVVVNEAQFSKFVHEKNGICGFGLLYEARVPPPAKATTARARIATIVMLFSF